MPKTTHKVENLAAKRTGPLAGIKVVDMTSVLLGPFATMLLADLGADVVKVESPRNSGGGSDAGDIWRYAGDTPEKGLGPMFVALNRNKRAVSLDLANAEDKAAFTELLRGADVFIHNVRMAGMGRLGFDYDAVKAINPSIVYVHCAGFGEDGPYAPLAAYDDLIQAASGYTYLPKMRDGVDPSYTPSAIADKTAGLFAANAVTAALFHRERTGEGQYVQVPMFESFTFFVMAEHLYGQTWESVDGSMGYARIINPLRQPYATLDGYISIVPYSDVQWKTFLTIGGYPDIFDDPKFKLYNNRTENIGELYGYIREAALTKTTNEWLAILQSEDIPSMRCNPMEDVLEDPHLTAVNFFQEQKYPSGETYRAMKHPIKYSATPAEIYRHPPKFGEHTDEVVGRSAEDMDDGSNTGAN